MATKKILTDLEIGGVIQLDDTNVDNDTTVGIDVGIVKNSTGTDWAANARGINAEVLSSSSGKVTQIDAYRARAEHSGSSQVGYLMGVNSASTNSGSGVMTGFYGVYNKLESKGTGVQTIDYMMGNTINVILDNPNATVNRLGALNAQLHFEATTTVNTEAYVAFLDIDKEDAINVDVDGDFSFLWVKGHTAGGVPTCTGTARALKIESTLPSTFAGSIGIGTTAPDSKLNLVETNVENNSTVGFNLDVSKENTSGAGFASNINGIKAYSKGNSSETIVNIAAVWGKAEHIGTGRTYYITGGTNRAYHSGTGDSNSVSGTFSEAKIGGTGVGNHEYCVGVNAVAYLDNANATVDYLQGQHCTVKLNAGEVTDNLMCLILDLDHTGGTISGDFEYLRIQNDTFNSSVVGTARAINSLSVLPSEFGGSIQAPTFYLGNSNNYIRENTGDVELYGDGSVVIESGDGVIVEISDVFHIDGALETTGAAQANSFVKNGGTSSQFLKADGSVDSSTYLTGTLPTDFVSAASGGTFNGALTIDSATDTIFKLNSTDNGALYVTYSRSNDRHAYVGFGGSSDNFTIMSEETGGQIILGTAATTRLTIEADGDVVIGANTTSASFIKSGGTSSQFLKADGSVDSTVYTGDQDLSGYLLNTTDTLTGKLTVTSSARVGDDTTTATSANEGALRYYTDALGSYVDMAMKTGASTYSWINIVRNIFSV